MYVLHMVQQPGSFGSSWGVLSTLHGSLSTVVSHADITSKPAWSARCVLQMLMDVEITAVLLDTQVTVPSFSLLMLWSGTSKVGRKCNAHLTAVIHSYRDSLQVIATAVLPCTRSTVSASSFWRQHSAPILPFNDLRTVSNRQVKACPDARITSDPFLPMP